MRSLSLFFFLLALVSVQALIGGVRQVFGLPAYLALAVSGVMLIAVRREPLPVRLSCLIAASVLAGWVVGRAAFSPVGYLARNDAFMVVAALIVYLAIALYYRDAKSRLIVMGVLMACVLVHTAVGAIQFKENNDFMLLPGIMRPGYGWRASGFYVCPNHLAGLLEMMGLAGLSVVCWGRCPKWVRAVLGYGVLMCLGGVAITGSRGGYLSILFGMGVFGVLSLWIVHRLQTGQFLVMLGAVLLGGGIIVGGSFFLMLHSETLSVRLGQVYEPTNMRPLMWRAAMTQFHIERMTGTGSGTYLYYGRQFRSPSVQNDPIHVHNDYVELLAEYGVIGAVLCGAFLGVHLFGGVARIKRIVDESLRPLRQATDNDLALVVGALSGISALLLHSIVDFNFHIPANTLVVSVLFGLLAGPMERAPEPEPAMPMSQLAWLRWVVPGISAVLLLCALRLLPGEVFAEKARVALRDDRNAEALAFAESGLAWETKNPNLYAAVGEAKHFLTLQAVSASSQHALHLGSAEAYRKALQLFPRDTNLLLKLGETLDLLGQFSEANDVYERAFVCDPNFGNAYAFYGRHCQMQHRFKAAERYYRRALEFEQWPVAAEGLQSIELMKKNPAAQTLMSLYPEPNEDGPVLPQVLRP